MKRRMFASLGLAAGLLAITPACGGGTAEVKLANVTPADMPTGADWTGVYFDRLYGYFHLVQEGKAVNGKWQRPQKDRWGELHGEVTGNLLKFTWTEYTVGAVGAASQRTGKGYLVYTRPEGEHVDDKADGGLGTGQSEVGEDLNTVKQRNQAPDLGSIGGTGATDMGGGDWDGANKEQGTPEPPAPPP